MISVVFEQNTDKGVLCFRINGHAGFGCYGNDVVCASASILAYTVAKTISFMYEEGKLVKKPNIRLKEGDAVITCKPKAEFYAEALHTYFVAEVGYSLLAQSYPQYVEIQPFGKPTEA